VHLSSQPRCCQLLQRTPHSEAPWHKGGRWNICEKPSRAIQQPWALGAMKLKTVENLDSWWLDGYIQENVSLECHYVGFSDRWFLVIILGKSIYREMHHFQLWGAKRQIMFKYMFKMFGFTSPVPSEERCCCRIRATPKGSMSAQGWSIVMWERVPIHHKCLILFLHVCIQFRIGIKQWTWCQACHICIKDIYLYIYNHVIYICYIYLYIYICNMLYI